MVLPQHEWLKSKSHKQNKTWGNIKQSVSAQTTSPAMVNKYLHYPYKLIIIMIIVVFYSTHSQVRARHVHFIIKLQITDIKTHSLLFCLPWHWRLSYALHVACTALKIKFTYIYIVNYNSQILVQLDHMHIRIVQVSKSLLHNSKYIYMTCPIAMIILDVS